MEQHESDGSEPPSHPHNRNSQTGRRGRQKPQLSCDECRRRKSRCDRKRPCTDCVSRGLTCVYPQSSEVPLSSSSTLRARSIARTSPHDRLDQLERLVLSMRNELTAANHRRQPLLGPNASLEGAENDIDSGSGSIHFSVAEHRYLNSDHWAAILESIADLKDHFDGQDHAEPAPSSDGPSPCDDGGPATGVNMLRRSPLIYGCRPASSRAELLNALPPRETVNRYVSRYFNRMDLVSSAVVHGPTFLQEYEAFWENPTRVSTIWLGLLFGMIALAFLATEINEARSGDDAEQENFQLQIELYRERIAQCLILSEYTKGGRYVLETIIHYVYVEFLLKPDADPDLWYLLALEVSAAKRMGYHRDPRHFSGISVLEAEMRRRLWATVLLGDILISNQMGMPRTTSGWQSDTMEPHNLNDSDLSKDTTELPPSRPDTEYTTTTGIIARTRLLVVLGTISDLMAVTKPIAYSEVLRIDKALNKALENVPPPLRMKSIESSMTDSQHLIIARLFLSHLFYNGQLLLHQRFLFMRSTSPDHDTFADSRESCLDACLGTLKIQQTMDEETCPGGVLDSFRWRVTSIMNHQFLTATMILCSLLYRGEPMDRTEELIAALRISQACWLRRSANSREAQKAAETVSMVFAKTGTSDEHSAVEMSTPTNITSTRTSDLEMSLGIDEHSMMTMNMNEIGLPHFFQANNVLPTGTLGELNMQQPVDIPMGDDVVDRPEWALPDWLTVDPSFELEGLGQLR